MNKIAILLTVYNRKEITIKGLDNLVSILKNMPSKSFDIFITNDGCTDGTEEEIKKSFPSINVINSSGNLFWSRGMNVAWEYASKKVNYDYYIWFNDDAILYPNAINDLFAPISILGNNIIVSGAFEDSNGQTSYGGFDKKRTLISPNGTYQDVFLVNGNLTLIPKEVFSQLGYIDKVFHHSKGDWDYGLRAITRGFRVILTGNYVGQCNRHDDDLRPYLNKSYTPIKRLKLLYSPKSSPLIDFYFNNKHFGLFVALRKFIGLHIYALFPTLLKSNNTSKKERNKWNTI